MKEPLAPSAFVDGCRGFNLPLTKWPKQSFSQKYPKYCRESTKKDELGSIMEPVLLLLFSLRVINYRWMRMKRAITYVLNESGYLMVSIPHSPFSSHEARYKDMELSFIGLDLRSFSSNACDHSYLYVSFFNLVPPSHSSLDIENPVLTTQVWSRNNHMLQNNKNAISITPRMCSLSNARE